MRRIFRPSALLGGTVACVLGLAPAAQAADGCANAAYREGAGARLPDCRAWEQVSPVDKNGTDVVTSSTIASVDGGDHVYFNAAGAFAGAESVLYDTAYVAGRGADWSTRGTDPPLTPTGLLVKATLGLSEDGTKAIVATSLALAPGAIAGGSNLYVRDLTQPSSYRLIVATASQGMYQEITGFGGQGNYIAGNSDLSAIAFQTTTPLLDGAPDGVRSLYLWHDGNLSLASRLPDGTTPDLAYDGNTPSRIYHRLSEDGTRVWFRTPYPEAALYQYVEGQGTQLISRSHRAGDDPDTPVTAENERASVDGRTLIFTAFAALTDDSVIPTGGGGAQAIFRLQPDGTLENLTASFTPEDGGLNMRIAATSPDGSLVWFISRARLTPDAGDGSSDRLYFLDPQADSLRFVARFDVETPYDFEVSPNGRTIAFLSFSSITGQDNRRPNCREPGYIDYNGYCGNIFSWSADSPEPVACLSCGPAGMARQGPAATFGRPSTRFDGRDSRAVLDDGTVFFDSADRLLAGDANTVGDVYEHTPGSGLSLLTPGKSAEPASFGDISEDGRDVFFVTAERLVPQDVDVLADLYSARVDGGIAAQQIPPGRGGEACSGAACRPVPAPVPPGGPVPGTSQYDAPQEPLEPEPPFDPDPRFRVRAPSASALRTAGRTGRLVLPVQVTEAGTVNATLRGRFAGRAGRTAARATGRARRAGTVRLTLRLSRGARQAIGRNGRLRLGLTVAYSEGTADVRRTLTFTTRARRAASRKGGSR